MNVVWCIRPLDIKYVTKNTGEKNKKFYHIKRIQKLLLSVFFLQILIIIPIHHDTFNASYFT